MTITRRLMKSFNDPTRIIEAAEVFASASEFAAEEEDQPL